MSIRISVGFVGLGLVLLLGISSLAAGPEDRIPASASLVLLLDKPSDAAAKWQETAIGSMFAGKDFAPFYKELEKGEIAAPLNPKPALGLDWADVAKFKAPAAFVILEGEAKSPAMVLLAGGKDDAAEVKRVMTEAEKYFAGRKAQRTAKKIAEGEVVTYELTAAAGEKGSVCVHVTHGDNFAATNSAIAVEKLLKQWEAGDKGSLAADVNFKKVDAQSRKMAGQNGADVRWFVRPMNLAELLQKKREPKMRGKDLVALARKLGLGAITSIGGICTLQPDASHDFEVAGLMIAKRPFESGLRLLDMRPGRPITPPAWVEADIGSYISWNMDFPSALDGAGSWIGEKLDDPGFLNAYLGDLRTSKQVDVRKDIIARLGPGIFEVSDSHRAKDPSNPNGERRLIGIASKEQPKLAKALKLVSREDALAKDETVGGNPLRTAPDGEPLFTEPDAGAPKNTKTIQAYAVTPTLSLLCTDVAWLRSKLSPKEKIKSLVDDPSYKQITTWTAKQEYDKTCLRGYVRSDQSMKLDYDVVRAGGVSPKSSSRSQALQYVLLGNSPAKGPAAALPKFDALAPHLLPTGVSMAVSPDGFELRAAVLRK
ncbi:MAG: hypothetical protein K8R36_00805 [Planctomycetales bacterium]|nr:hypothetical protein [Planctomycetales bacterium]